MFRKTIQIILLLASLLILTAAPKPVSSADPQVAVWIPGSPSGAQSLDISKNLLVIDYGSFSWVVISHQELSQLDSAGVEYQRVENPFTLTLGGQSFDPLYQTPAFSASWGLKPEAESPGLRLVQFQGPIKDAWLDGLTGNGLTVLQYIHPYTYLVWGDNPALVRSKTQNAFIRWSGDYLPAYAVLPQNRILMDEPILARMMVYPGAGLYNTLNAIESLGGTITSTSTGTDPVFDLVTMMIPGNLFQSVASLSGVVTVQPVPTDGGDRGEMSSQVNAGNIDSLNRAFTGYLPWLNSLGLSGEGVVIANVDSGIDQNHPDLLNRMLPCVGTTCGEDISSTHGTHTAGIMAGDGSSGVLDANGFFRGLGMSPGANLVEQIYRETIFDPIFPLDLLIKESHNNNAVISGNSWGPSSTPLGYDLDTRLVDIGVRDADPATPGNQPLTYLLSIMNGYGGTSTQGTPDEAKNIFSVGSTSMQFATGAQNLEINNISSNSAHGPALDGRNIPHMVAPGCYVDSTYSGAGYGLMCGTSMASPQVSGAAALFYERYRNLFGVDPSPAMVKAAFLPVAHDLAGYRDADGAVMGHPFDSKQGWGRLNAGSVLAPPGSVYYYDQLVTFSNTGETWSASFMLTEPVQSLRAMLVWTDAPGLGVGGSTSAWVNDLNLSLSAKGLTYLGNNFGSDGFSISGGSPDFMNNTEGIFLSNTPSGTYTFTISAANIAGDGIPNFGDGTDQDFAFVIYVHPYNQIYQHYLPFFFE
jgi:subtilisin family serine protease